MSPSAHAVLSPSSADRWISCPASVRVIEDMNLPKDEGSVYAAEGTAAHALAEIEASFSFGMITQRQRNGRYNKWHKEEWTPLGLTAPELAEMHEHVADYLALIAERMALYPNSILFLEQRMPTGVPSSWGTSDVVIVSPEHVEIIDLKYGQGIAVSAWDNPQLRLYGLGALDTYGDVLGDTKVVRTTIFQPRLDSTSTEEMTADELRAWREDVVIPRAKLALEDGAPFGPSDKACRWCPAAGLCLPRVRYMTAIDFGQEPDLIEPDELGELLKRLPDIRSWVASVEAAALTKAYSEGVEIPGWKVVLSGGQRTITDPAAATAAFVERGFAEDDIFTKKMVGLGDLEKLLKTLPKVKPADAKRPRYQTLEDVLPKASLGRTPGKESLVRDTDRRSSINPNNEAAKEFTE